MKKFLILSISLLFFVSCKTTYVYKGTEQMVFNYTMTVPSCHHHYGDSLCVYIDPWDIEFSDTLEIEIWKPKKRFK